MVQGFWTVGAAGARPPRIAARSYDELDCWNLANELKRGVYALVKGGDAAHDLKFRDQLRDAAASAPRNIAEGFGRYQPKDFAQYLRVANGSLMETANHLQDGVDRGYFTTSAIAPLLVLVRRSSAATTRLIRYLATAKPPHPRTKEPPLNPRTKEPKNRNPST